MDRKIKQLGEAFAASTRDLDLRLQQRSLQRSMEEHLLCRRSLTHVPNPRRLGTRPRSKLLWTRQRQLCRTYLLRLNLTQITISSMLSTITPDR
jgi:hypothetical protein